jgi:O-Antigen ligase
MASSVAIPRSYLIYGVCLPLAVLIGYLLADPLDSGSIAVIVLVLCVLSVPVVLRWHHPLLVLSWNSFGALFFCPGKPALWMVLTAVSFFVTLLNRAIGRPVRFFEAPAVAKSLLCLGAIVWLTARLNGGVGFQALGATTIGAKRYVSLYGAIMCYFALAANRVEVRKAGLYMGLFWLGSLAVFLGYLGALVPGLDFLFRLFPAETELMGERAFGNSVLVQANPLFRLGSMLAPATGILFYLLARHGIRGVLDLKRPWRLPACCLAIVAVLVGGFRAAFVACVLVLACVFYLEGLCRPRYLLMLAGAGLAGAVVMVPLMDRMPLSVQRTLSFLPVSVDPIVRRDADASTEWRLDMWKEVLPQVPKYFFRGKGYGLDPHEMYEANLAEQSGTGVTAETAMISGDYHSGPLSVAIPLGIYGVAAFVWFLYASIQVLYGNYRYGDPALKTINALLLANFLVRTFSFIFMFGSLYSDLIGFCGTIGISVSLNGVARRPEVPEPVEEEEEA